MPDFLLELLSEEIPARMQAKARADLARLFEAELVKAGLKAEQVETYATPRRLALIARGLPLGTPATSEELKGPRTSAPPQALEGFLRKTGLSPDQLTDREGIWFALLEKPGRATTDVLAEAVPAIVRAFPWPKSMRWGAASLSTESLRWVRPLQGIVAMLDEEVVEFEIGDVSSGAATIGHRFHHPGRITLAGAKDYVEKLKACHVIVDQDERARLIREGAQAAAAAEGLTLVPDQGLVEENAGLTEWPVPLLGRFDEAFLKVPREVIQLTMRTNQKYFACTKSSPAFAGEGDRPKGGGGAGEAGSSLDQSTTLIETLAPAFICVANIAATDGGAKIVAGNQKVLAARLSDARFFWDQDLKVPLEDQAQKLSQIVFHEKLGTVADKVDRVAKLARWLVEEGIVTSKSSPAFAGEGDHAQHGGGGSSSAQEPPPSALRAATSPRNRGEDQAHLANLAERAARLCKADLVTRMVGEFPELQGLIGGYLAEAQGEDPQIAAAIRDHYKPVGQGDDVPTAPVAVAVSLADKLDSIVSFFSIDEEPTGSKDPFALRRSSLAALRLINVNDLRLPLTGPLEFVMNVLALWPVAEKLDTDSRFKHLWQLAWPDFPKGRVTLDNPQLLAIRDSDPEMFAIYGEIVSPALSQMIQRFEAVRGIVVSVLSFFADRLKVQQREAGVRHDLIDAVFALGGEDDLVRLLARVRALQAFVETSEGKDLLAGYKRAANILRREGWAPTSSPLVGEDRGGGPAASAAEETPFANAQLLSAADAAGPHPNPSPQGGGALTLSYTPETEETALIAALDSAEPRAAEAIAQEDFEGAMAALATLRGPVDAFFDKVTVNDPAPDKRAARLGLLARMRSAFHQIADFSRIEG